MGLDSDSQDPSRMETENLKHQIDDLENKFSDLKFPDKSCKVNEIKRFIFEHRNKLNLSDLDKVLDGRVKQLIAQTSGYRAWFLSEAKKEEIREKAKCLDLLRVSMLDAREKIREERAKEANRQLSSIIESFQFSALEKNHLTATHSPKDCLNQEEYKFYFHLIENLALERNKEIYIQMIHFVMNYKDVLDDKLLLDFTKLLDQRIQKIEYIIKNKQKAEQNYSKYSTKTPYSDEILNSSKLKINMTSLKDLRDLISTEVEKRAKVAA